MSKLIYAWLSVLSIIVFGLFYMQCLTTHSNAVAIEQSEQLTKKVETLYYLQDHPKRDTVVISNQIHIIGK